MKPPISYYGGKQRIAKHIVELIPKHMVYVEPFAGGCSILFNKPYLNISNDCYYREVINDYDVRLINFFVQLRDNGDELLRRIRLTLYSEFEHRVAKDMNTGDLIENARRYYLNIMQSFSNRLNGGWSRSVRNKAGTWKNKLASLDQYIDRMRGIYVSDTDAIDCIKVWDAEDTFFYVDPPYVGANQGHYKGFVQEDLDKLCEVLNNIKGSFILSGYNNESVNKYGWERYEINAVMSSAKNKSINKNRTEILWRKLSNNKPSELAKKLYDKGLFDCFIG